MQPFEAGDGSQLRILAAYRHFWPDSPPYAELLRSIAAHLSGEGHSVEVVAEHPCYKTADFEKEVPSTDRVDGVRVKRMPVLPGTSRQGLIDRLDQFLFPIRLLIHGIVRRLRGASYDVVLTATQPPVINGTFGWLTARLLGARFLYHFQDVYPELGRYAGLWDGEGVVYRLLYVLDRFTCRMADRCVVLSDDMAETLVERGVDREKIMVVHNFMPSGFEEDRIEARPTDRSDRQDVVLIFAGNLGRFQGLEPLVRAAQLVEEDLPNLTLEFLGEGVALPRLKQLAVDISNVRFRAHLPTAEADRVISEADVGIVSLRPDIYRVAYPTKTMTYLGLGVPILAVVESESSLARLVEREHLGFVVSGREPNEVAEAYRKVYQHRRELPELRDRARQTYNCFFSRDSILSRWTDLMDEIAS